MAAHAISDGKRPERLRGDEPQIVGGNVRCDRRGHTLEPDREESILIVRALAAFGPTGDTQVQLG